MQSKACSTCQQEKPVSEFFKGTRYKDGYRGQCKACSMAKAKEYIQTDKGRIVAREASKQWRINNPEQVKAKAQAWYSDGGKQYHREQRHQHKEKYQGYVRKYAQEHRQQRAQYVYKDPEKRKAKAAANNAVIRGDLPHVGTQVCRKCGNQAEHYHHWSYLTEHWLDVIPLCHQCHAETHYPPD